MKNIFGTQENVTLYHKNGETAYTFYKHSTGYYWCKTHDDQGRVTSLETSEGVSWKRIYDNDGTYKQIDLTTK